MLYNVFSTEQDAIDAEAIDFKIWMASRNKEPYKTNTLRYAEVKETKDNRFAYPVLTDGMQIYTQKELSNSDFKSDE